MKISIRTCDMQIGSKAPNHEFANIQWVKWKPCKYNNEGFRRITLHRVGHKWPPTQPTKNQTREKAL